MKQMITLSLILAHGPLITAEKPFHDSPTAFHRGHTSIVPACEDAGKKLCIHFFKQSTPVKEYSVTLKEGRFLEESLIIIDQTPYCIDAEKVKNKNELKKRIQDYTYWQTREREHQKNLFKQELARRKSLLEEQYGKKARMTQVYGEPVTLEANGHLIFLQCQAIIEGRQVTLEVDLAHFCDNDAWAKIINGLRSWQWQKEEEYEENYFSNISMINL